MTRILVCPEPPASGLEPIDVRPFPLVAATHCPWCGERLDDHDELFADSGTITTESVEGVDEDTPRPQDGPVRHDERHL